MSGDRPDPAEDGMGVSSEREGPTGPGQHGTTGVFDSSPPEPDPDADTQAEAALPEQSTGNPETNPEGLEPKAGYSSKDPRSD